MTRRTGKRRAVFIALLALALTLSSFASPATARVTDRPETSVDEPQRADGSRVTTARARPLDGTTVPHVPVGPPLVDGDPSDPGGSVVGGTPTSHTEHPYYVEVGTTTGYFCGGSLIDPDWVLTAAHCVEMAGATVKFAGPTSHSAVEVIVHPLWDGDAGNGHDLALLRLPPGASAGADVVQVGSPFRPVAYEVGRSVELVGHGATSSDGTAGLMMDVTMPIRSDGDMESIYDPWWFPFINKYDRHLMIGAGTSTKGACFGDSGGPLTGFVGSTRVQIGVTSFGWPDCKKPQVYSELNGAHLAWLATEVPAITQRWASCQYGGTTGKPSFGYSFGTTGAANRDGNYSWHLGCGPINPRPPHDPKEPPPICDLKPRKCDLDL